jgi:hypothetical protein
MHSAFICKPWLDLWLVIFYNKIWVWIFLKVPFFSMRSSILSSLLQVQLFNNASSLQCFLCDESVSMVWGMNCEHFASTLEATTTLLPSSCCIIYNATHIICFLFCCSDCWTSKFAWTICIQASQAPHMGVLR